MSELAVFHMVIRISHIAAGFLGLLLFWIPVFARKGGTIHVRCGKIFVGTAYYISATASISCVWALVDPLSFVGLRTSARRKTPLYCLKTFDFCLQFWAHS